MFPTAVLATSIQLWICLAFLVSTSTIQVQSWLDRIKSGVVINLTLNGNDL